MGRCQDLRSLTLALYSDDYPWVILEFLFRVYLIIIGVFLVVTGEKKLLHHVIMNLFFNNHVTMTTSNDDSDLEKTPASDTYPFTLAARSIASSKPANHTRNKAT